MITSEEFWARINRAYNFSDKERQEAIVFLKTHPEIKQIFADYIRREKHLLDAKQSILAEAS